MLSHHSHHSPQRRQVKFADNAPTSSTSSTGSSSPPLYSLRRPPTAPVTIRSLSASSHRDRRTKRPTSTINGLHNSSSFSSNLKPFSGLTENISHNTNGITRVDITDLKETLRLEEPEGIK